MARRPKRPLRRGWTTGACATAATSAAYSALLTGEFPDPVAVALPGGRQPAFALAFEELGDGCATAGIIKDAGDDPDVTHGALVKACIRRGDAGSGVVFRAGDGIGTVTLDGLPLRPGEPAINPAPRGMMRDAVAVLAARYGDAGDVEIEISIPGGGLLAEKTWNPRLGITGGLSVLGTTGVVIPFSCAAWIEAIHQGIDVARAAGLVHVAGCTGRTSEKAVQAHHNLPDSAMLDMGDFAGGLLKYLRIHPLPRLTIGGGFAKLAKLGAGYLDLHSGRSQVDFHWLAALAAETGAAQAAVERIASAASGGAALALALEAGIPLGDAVAARARQAARKVLGDCAIDIDVLAFDRNGRLVGRADG